MTYCHNINPMTRGQPPGEMAMNDPHVAELIYWLDKADSLEFRDPPPVGLDTPEFSGRLENGELRLIPKNHYSTELEARSVTDHFVERWEIATGLSLKNDAFKFSFRRSHIIDRSPSPGLHIYDSLSLTDSATLSIKVIRTSYPAAPPLTFNRTERVKVLWERYKLFLNKNEPLLSMAYSCLTFLEWGQGEHSGGREPAALFFGIDLAVLKKIGEISSDRGDPLTARKFNKKIIPLASEEETWIREAIPAIIRHIASDDPGKSQLLMSDLPKPP